jgi:hypothetical protein
MATKHMWGEVHEFLVDDKWPHNPHLDENSHERPFSIISKVTPTNFDQEMVSTRKPRMLPMVRKHIWSVVYEPLVDD